MFLFKSYKFTGRILFLSKFLVPFNQFLPAPKNLTLIMKTTSRQNLNYKILLVINIFTTSFCPKISFIKSRRLSNIANIKSDFSTTTLWFFLTRFLIFMFSIQEENKFYYVEKNKFRNFDLNFDGCNPHFELDYVFKLLKIDFYNKINFNILFNINSSKYIYTEFFLNFCRIPVLFR